MKKREEGITLIALIITIIILVILAAVSIRAAYSSGIIDYSINGTKKYQEEANKEKSILSDTEGFMKSILSKINNLSEENDSGITINLSISGTKLKDNQTALAGLPTITAGTQASTKSVYTDGAGAKAIIPVGFTVSTVSGENTISDGLVVRDSNGNEFVWIPVDQDQVISLSVTSKEDITSIVLYNPYGDKIIDLTNQGKSYNEAINTYGNMDCVNGGYTAVVTTANEEASKKLTVRSLYAADTFNDYYTSDEYAEVLGYSSMQAMIEDYLSEDGIYRWDGFEDETEFLEDYGYNNLSEFLEDYDCENIYEYFGTNYEEYAEYIIAMCGYESMAPFKNYKDLTEAEGSRVIYSESINSNGGFYIGRYEAGAPINRTSGNENDTVSKIITENGIPVSKANQIVYKYLTRDQAKGLAESMYNSIEFTCTLLPWAAWDRTLGFLTELGNNSKTVAHIAYDSKSWGNYDDIQFTVENANAKYTEDYGRTYLQVSNSYTKQEYSSVLFTTGATERNSSKNIYDIAGNWNEWVSASSYFPYQSGYLMRGVDMCPPDYLVVKIWDVQSAYSFTYTGSSAYDNFRFPTSIISFSIDCYNFLVNKDFETPNDRIQ